MTLRTVPATRSLTWLSHAAILVFMNPAFLLMGLFVGVLGALPILGPLVLLLITPALHGGICHAARERLEGRPVHFTHLFEAFNQPGKIGSMLALSLPGILTLVTLIAGLTLILLPAGLDSDSAQPAPDAAEIMTLLMPKLGVLGGVMFVLGILVFVLTFLAIPGVMFTPASGFRAMRMSLLACSRNAPAIVLYLLSALLVMVPLFLLIPLMPIVMNLLISILVTPMIAVSACLAWIDICQPTDSPSPPPPDEGGLVA